MNHERVDLQEMQGDNENLILRPQKIEITSSIPKRRTVTNNLRCILKDRFHTIQGIDCISCQEEFSFLET